MEGINLKDDKIFSRNDIICICIALLIFLFALLLSPLSDTTFEEKIEDTPTEQQISIYDNDHVDIDTDIISSIKTYFNDKYSDMTLISVHIDHFNNEIIVSVSVAEADTTDYMILGLPVWRVRKVIDREGEVSIIKYYFMGLPVYAKQQKYIKHKNVDNVANRE